MPSLKNACRVSKILCRSEAMAVSVTAEVVDGPVILFCGCLFSYLFSVFVCLALLDDNEE